MEDGKGTTDKPVLICRNVFVNGRRTSLRMEPMMWDALDEICDREGQTLDLLCSELDRRRGRTSRTAAIRVFIISYLRAAFAHTTLRHFGDGDGNTVSAVFRKALDDAVPFEG